MKTSVTLSLLQSVRTQVLFVFIFGCISFGDSKIGLCTSLSRALVLTSMFDINVHVILEREPQTVFLWVFCHFNVYSLNIMQDGCEVMDTAELECEVSFGNEAAQQKVEQEVSQTWLITLNDCSLYKGGLLMRRVVCFCQLNQAVVVLYHLHFVSTNSLLMQMLKWKAD